MDVTPFLEVTLRTEDEIRKELREPVTEFCEVQMKEEPPDEPSENGNACMKEDAVEKSSEDESAHEECERPLMITVPEVKLRVGQEEKMGGECAAVDESEPQPIDLSQKRKRTLQREKLCDYNTSDSDCDLSAVAATEAKDLPGGRRAVHPPSTKKHICSVCKKAFATPSHLRTHMRTHTGTRPYECPECKTTFTQSNNLRRHLRVHTRERPYKCTECECAFRDSSHLQRHRLLHTGEKPFQCEVCGASFAQSNTLRDHKRLHTGERPFGCADCNETFVRRSHLNAHNQRVHGAPPAKAQINAAAATASPVPAPVAAAASAQ